jgi:cupin fold WbuC family metalloprotein
MRGFNAVSDNVLYCTDDFVDLNTGDIAILRDIALRSSLDKIRICTHSSITSSLHEMFIYHSKNAYVRPHKHIDKVESFTLIEGEVDAIFYDDESNITKILSLGKGESKTIYYRLPSPVYHSIVIRSEYALFYETTTGPFINEDTTYAPWSPGQEDREEIECFLIEQDKKIVRFLSEKNRTEEE